MSRCIQRLVEDELVQHYQRGSMPDEKIRNTLESAGVITSCIQRLAEDELVQHYQRDSMPDEETRNALESARGIT